MWLTDAAWTSIRTSSGAGHGSTASARFRALIPSKALQRTASISRSAIGLRMKEPVGRKCRGSFRPGVRPPPSRTIRDRSDNKQDTGEKQDAQDDSSKHRFIGPAKGQDSERRPG